MPTLPDNLHQAVWDWLATCASMGDMFFNSGRADDGNTTIFPSDQLLDTYIDGSTKRNYIATLTRFLPFSTDPNDITNINSLVDFDEIGEWVEEQLDAGNLPSMPDGYEVTDIEVLPNNAGYVAALDMTHAKFQLQIRFEYIRARIVHATSANG